MTIVDLQRLQIECNIDDSNIGRMHVGQEVSFNVDAFPSDRQKRVVRAIFTKAELVNSVVNYIVVVEVLNKNALAPRLEMTARVNFVLRSKDGIVTAHGSAVIREGGRSYVLVRNRDGWGKRKICPGCSNS